MAHYKKRKPFIVRLLIWLFWIIFIIALAFAGVWGYFYFAKNIDVVGAFSSVNSLGKPVDESEIALKPITAEDVGKVTNQFSSLGAFTSLIFTDGEIGAYINEQVDQGLTANLGGGDITLSAWDFKLLSFGITTNDLPQNRTANINITFKFNATELKKQMGAFPLSLLKGKIPDVLYITTNAGIEQTTAQAEDAQFTIKPLDIKINNLSDKQTENILNFAGTFVKGIDADEMAKQIATAFINPILAQDGTVMQNLNQFVGTGMQANFEFQDGAITFSLTEAKFDVAVTQLIDGTATTAPALISGTGEGFVYGANVTLLIIVNTGYTFLGWFESETATTPLTTETTYQIVGITADTTLFAKFEYIQQTITYHNTKDAQNPNPTTYNIASGEITLSNLALTGYDFLGWYTTATFEDGTLANSVQAGELQNFNLYAKWAPTKYSITYNLNGGSMNNANKSEYTIETATFTLSNPVKADTEFVGWTGTNLTESTKTVTINQGTTGNLAFTAHWLYDAQVNLWVDGNLEQTFDYSTAHPLTLDMINSNIDVSAFGAEGYTLKNWYTDASLTTLFTQQYISGTINLYSTAEYFTNEILFYPYMEIFDNAIANNSQMTFSTRADLLAWMDYVYFFHITGNPQTSSAPYPKFKLEYIDGDAYDKMDEVAAAYAEYKTIATYQSVATMVNYSNVYFFISSTGGDNIDDMASVTADPQKTQVQSQMASAQTLQNSNPRANNFDDFAINDIKNTIPVSNSEQLVHVLEQGYKPICQAGSDAETIYNLAKNVLREICNDDMTTTQKLRAIYEWLVLNVQYDHYAANNITDANTSRHYKAWFAEGVFLDGVAVCEGFAKSALILSRLEGIPAIIATGNNHAWNKMMIDGKWYTFDATHGNKTIAGQEVISYNTFLFPDSYRPTYQASEYPEIQSTTAYNFYTDHTVWHDGASFDFHINTNDEMTTFVNYAKATATANIFSFEVTTSGIQFHTVLAQVANNAGLTYDTYQISDSNGQTVYIIIFTKSA